MNNILVRARYAIKTGYFFIIAFRNNLIAEFLDWRFEIKKRRWTAKGTFGSGVVPLGWCNLKEATLKTARFGTVINVDVEMAIIFYKEKE